MTNRTTERLPLLSNSPGTKREIIVHRYAGPEGGKKAYFQASLHADETPAMLTLHHLIRQLDALNTDEFLAEIVVVPYANPIGLSQFLSGRHLGRNELNGGGNFNRDWPDLLAGLPEKLVGRLGQDADENVQIIRATLRDKLADLKAVDELSSLRVTLAGLAIDADLVMDVHCDDDALLHLFILPDHWPLAAPISAELGCEAVLLASDSGGGPFDEFCSTLWPRLQSHFRDFPIPSACLGGTLELRGRPDVSDELAAKDARALLRALRHLGYLVNDGCSIPAPLCEATDLAACDVLKAPSGGILSYCLPLGAEVEKGDQVAWLINPAAEDPEQGRIPILSKSKGKILSRRQFKYVPPNASIAKIVGNELLEHRIGGDLLEA